VRQIPELVW